MKGKKVLYPLIVFLLIFLTVFFLPPPAISQENANPPLPPSSPSTVALAGIEPNFIVHSPTNVTLYSDFIAINVVYDGNKRFDRLLDNTKAEPWNNPPISYWCKWRVDWYKGTPPNNPWVALTEDAVSFSQPIKNATGVYLTVTSKMNDGSIFTITYKLEVKSQRLKWDLKLNASTAWSTKYRFTYEYFTPPSEKTSFTKEKKIVFTYPQFSNPPFNYTITFLYDDVDTALYQTTEQWDSVNHKHYFSIDLGSFNTWQIKEIDPSTVATSSAEDATRLPFQRKTFYANGRFWVFWGASNTLYYASSTDGSTWSSATSLGDLRLENQFSIWFDGTYVHYVRVEGIGKGVYYRRGLPNSDGSITWESEYQIAYSNTLNAFCYPSIAVSSSGYAFISVSYLSAYFNVYRNTKNDGSWSGVSYTLEKTAGDYFSAIVPLTSDRMLVAWTYSENTQGVRIQAWDGSSWLPQLTTTTAYNWNKLSLTSIGDYGHLIFNDGVYVKYTYSSNSLSDEVNLGGGVTIAARNNGDLYVFSSSLSYKKYDAASGTWSSSWITWVSGESPDSLSINAFAWDYGNKIGVVWTRSAIPYNVRFAYMNLNSPPTNNGLSLINPSIGTQGCLAQKQAYIFRVQVTDPDGGANLNYVEITLDPDGQNLKYRWTESTNTFSEINDPNNYASISSTSADSTLSGNQWTLDFKITFAWTYPDENLHNVQVYSLDDDGASDTDTYTNIYYVENDLVFSGLTVSDTRVNPGQTLTFSGTIYYQGTTITPPDGNYNVKVKLNGVQKGSTDTTLVSGQFSINDVTAESTVGSYTYTVECDYMAGAGSFPNVIVDRLTINYKSSPQRTTISDSAILKFKLRSEYDNAFVTSGSVMVNGTSATWDGNYWSLSVSQNQATKKFYAISSVNWDTYGITALNPDSPLNSTYVIWDEIQFNQTSINPLSGTTYTKFNISAYYIYNGSYVNNAIFYVWDGLKCVGQATSTNGLIQFTLNSTLHGQGQLIVNGSDIDGVKLIQLTIPYNVSVLSFTANIPNEWVSGEAQAISISFQNNAKLNETHLSLENVKFRVTVLDVNTQISKMEYEIFNVNPNATYSTNIIFIPTNITRNGNFIIKVQLLQLGSEYELANNTKIVYINIGSAAPGGGGSEGYPFTLSLLGSPKLTLMPGETKEVELQFKWEGASSISITNVEFFGSEAAKWCKWKKNEGTPSLMLWGSAYSITIQINPPVDAPLGSYEVTVKVEASDTQGNTATSFTKLTLEVGKESSTITSGFTSWILIGLIGAFAIAVFASLIRKK